MRLCGRIDEVAAVRVRLSGREEMWLAEVHESIMCERGVDVTRGVGVEAG